jgi:cell division protease FtsH
MERQVRFNIWFAILAVFGILFLQELWVQYGTVAPIAYSEFVAQLKEGNVVPAPSAGADGERTETGSRA